MQIFRDYLQKNYIFYKTIFQKKKKKENFYGNYSEKIKFNHKKSLLLLLYSLGRC